MSTATTIILFLSLAIAGLIIYSEGLALLHGRRMLISSGYLALGLIYLLLGYGESPESLQIGYFSTPIVVSLIFTWADSYSRRHHNRGFQLHARGAKTMIGLGFKKHNRHYSLSDKVFSSIMLIMVLAWAPGLVLLRLLIDSWFG